MMYHMSSSSLFKGSTAKPVRPSADMAPRSSCRWLFQQPVLSLPCRWDSVRGACGHRCSDSLGSCSGNLQTSPGESTTARGTWLVLLRSGAAVFSRIPLLFLPAGTLANKVKRKDTLAMKLGTAAAPQEEKVVFPRKSKEEWNEIRHQIGTTLIR